MVKETGGRILQERNLQGFWEESLSDIHAGKTQLEKKVGKENVQTGWTKKKKRTLKEIMCAFWGGTAGPRRGQSCGQKIRTLSVNCFRGEVLRKENSKTRIEKKRGSRERVVTIPRVLGK